MYEQHWQLRRPAFRSTAHRDFFFPGRTHEAAVLKLRYLIDQQQGIAVVTGPSGIGKSCVLESFCETVPHGPVISVLYPQLTSSELLGYLTTKLEARDVTVGPTTGSLDHVLQRLEQQLIQATQTGRPPVFVIDDAHLIADRKVFQTLQTLLNYRRAEQIEFSIILAGHPELVGQLKRYEALYERLAFVSTLQPFEADETAAYVQHRLQAAGRTTAIFDTAALQAIHTRSQGLPRRINRLCDFALLVGYADNLDHVTESQIDAVAEELSLAA
jgi:MSHA biogenesis protein MshM